MKTYFDLSDKERAALTEDTVRRYCDIQLMEKGVAKPTPPTAVGEMLADIGLKTVNLYSVGGVLFDSQEKAVTFLALKPVGESYEYSIGYEFKFPKPIDEVPKLVTLYSRDSVIANGTRLAEISAAKAAASKQQDEYDKAIKATTTAVADIWSDWRTMRVTAMKFERMQKQLAEYEELAGDRDTAMRFLVKAHGEDEVNEMLEWFDLPRLDAPRMLEPAIS